MSILFPNMFESLICHKNAVNISQRLLEEKSQRIWIIKVKLFFSWIDECNAIKRANWTKFSNLYIYIYIYKEWLYIWLTSLMVIVIVKLGKCKINDMKITFFKNRSKKYISIPLDQSFF